MTTALIFAGGTGIRMKTSAKPKQFLELYGKPVIVYTLEHFERHSEVDNIIVVCVKQWIDELYHLLEKYSLKKITQVVPGGSTGDKSIFNGLKALEDKCKPDDIVLIHDGVRPLISEELISMNISMVKENGNAISVEPTTESIVQVNSGGYVLEVPQRHEMYLAKAPQSFRYNVIWDLYQRAQADGVSPIDSAHLCYIYGIEMFTVRSTPNNIKITTPADYYIFRALYEAMENEQILGL